MRLRCRRHARRHDRPAGGGPPPSPTTPTAGGQSRADGTGALVGTADYDAFGAVRASAGVAGTFGFAGEQLDPETGRVHLRARQYAPGLGRFLSPDPEFPGGPGTQGWNPSAYAANNPTTPTAHSVPSQT